ncbi:MAG: hypothetical protein M0R32_05760 [Candidatus Cloacimonetes bacterium]|jgi:hypothetical protein|nr:hypothetical protein [Candidatus Cloacimonadota bacterium]
MNEVAQIIYDQLGGGRFSAMTGAKSFIASDNSLSFSLPGSGGFTKNGINRVSVVLNSMDLYDITFTRVRGAKVTPVEEKTNIYAEDLQMVFKEVTGLNTSL